jgi:hypothetical protein
MFGEGSSPGIITTAAQEMFSLVQQLSQKNDKRSYVAPLPSFHFFNSLRSYKVDVQFIEVYVLITPSLKQLHTAAFFFFFFSSSSSSSSCSLSEFIIMIIITIMHSLQLPGRPS